MGGIESVPMPSYEKGYDYNAGTWKSIAVNKSGEVGLRRGEVVKTIVTILPTAASGGQALGSGRTVSGFTVDRVHISIPRGISSGSINYSYFWLSGRTDYGFYIGGCSNQAPYRPAAGGFVGSGRGLFLGPGAQDTFYVDSLDQIYVCGGTSGQPFTYVAECLRP